MRLASLEIAILVFIFVAGIGVGISVEPYIYFHPDRILDGIPLKGSADDLPPEHIFTSPDP